MIDEAIGKILGMAMAYGVSALGLVLAYVNYRRRVVKAERVMSGAAWTVAGVTLLAILAATLVVVQLARSRAAEPSPAPLPEVAAPAVVTPPATAPPLHRVAEGQRWPLAGILLPAAIFLFATWVTAALYRHFSQHGHGPPAAAGNASSQASSEGAPPH